MRGATAGRMRLCVERGGARCVIRRDASRERDGEDAPFVDALLDLAEPGARDQLVHLGLRAPAHHPRLAAAMARQRARDELELRMPRLAV